MRFLNASLWELSKIEFTDLFFPFNFQHALKVFLQDEERKAKVSSRFDAINIIDPVLTLEEPLLRRS